ncbi:YSIRK-type signal peptide-containing protein, partial [Staphylococcus pseudintermedius]|nr:YSIRK-type signal peptide-containing protein [Staphylococcus pseudintermedius]
MKSKYDFLPNRLNKFSIRKFTVGSVSVLIGATLLFGFVEGEASASVKEGQQSINSSEKESADPTVVDLISKKETNLDGLDVSREETTKVPINENKRGEEQSISDKAITEKADTPVTNLSSKEVEEQGVSDKAITEKADTPVNNLSSKEVEEQGVSDKAITEKADTPVSNLSSKEAEEQGVSDKAITEKADTPVSNLSSKEAGEQGAADKAIEKIADASATDLSSKEEVEQDISTQGKVKSKEAVQVESSQLQNLNSEINAEPNEIKAIDRSSILPLNLNDEENNKKVDKGTRVPEATLRNSSNNQLNTRMRSVSLFRVARLTEINRNVNDKVKVSDIDIAIAPPHTNPKTGKEEFWATSSSVLKLKASYELDNSISKGDQFTIQFGQNIRPGGLNLPRPYNFLYDKDKKLVATGRYNKESNTITYTFTDYVDKHQNIKGSFEMNAFSRKENATTDKTAYPMDVTIANQKYSENIIVDYGNKKNAAIISSTEYIDLDGSRKMTTYINQNGSKNSIYRADMQIDLNGYKFDPSKNNFKIYEVENSSDFVDSFSPDVSKLRDVTSQFNIQYTNNNTMAKVDFGTNLWRGKKYIIQQVANIDDSKLVKNASINYTLNKMDFNNKRTVETHNNTYSTVKDKSTALGDVQESQSISESQSVSESESLSESQSISESESLSESQSISESESLSESQSISESESLSESQSISESESLSESQSISESESLSESQSISESESLSESQSISESESLSESQSVSESESLSESQSISESESLSESQSISESESLSESQSISESESLSESQSISESESLSESQSISESESLSESQSISESESLSESQSISESESLSESQSISESESLSESQSISESESLSES